MRHLILLTFTTLLSSGVSFSQNTLYIPPVLTGDSISLTLQEGTVNFFTGVTTNTMGANGNLLGPTLILNKDSFVNIVVNNQLTDTTTIHWHGMHVAPKNDGGPHSIIPPSTIWNPQFTVMDRAGINWYHPHLHKHTDEHVSKGIAGLIIVKDSEEAALNLPRSYGIDDFPIILQTKGFDNNGQIEVHTEMDTTFMINGTINPYLNAPAQVVRFRILNGSSQRAYNFGLSANLSFELIGTDGGLLEAPVSLTRYLIAPGQRADILIDLTAMAGQSLSFMNYGTEISNGIYGASQAGMMPQATIPDYNNNPLNGADFELLQVNITGQTNNPVTSIPSNLVSHNPWAESDADTTRTFTFTSTVSGPGGIVGPFVINSNGFDMEVINETVPLGNTEIWTLTNQSPIAHPFHIHDVQFYILDINGTPPSPEMAGLNDVVLVPAGQGTVRFITRFLDFADEETPFMYHCHMLTHEDMGMMGQFIVADTSTSTILNDKNIDVNKISIYPNPVSDKLILKNYSKNNIQIIGITGNSITKKVYGNIVDIKDLSQGVYFIKTNDSVLKFVKN